MSESKKNGHNKEIKVAVTEPPTAVAIPTIKEIDSFADYKNHRPKFCFINFDPDDKIFGIEKIQKAKIFWQLFRKLKMLSGMTWGDIEKGEYHAHDVPWHNSCKKKFPTGCGEFPAYQFGGSGSFRVVGFHDQGIFYIVWLDPEHKFWPMH